MSGQDTDEKVTLQVAAKALGVSDRSIQRYITSGQLTKIKEGKRTFIRVSDLRILRQQLVGQENDKNDMRRHFEDIVTNKSDTASDIVTVPRTHYDGLLTRLGQLEAKQELLIEYKADLETKEKELAELKAKAQSQEKEIEDTRTELSLVKDKAQEIEFELERLKTKKPWWKRLFGKETLT